MRGYFPNRLVFSALLATAVIPLPAMTPALLSGKLGAMSLVAEAGSPYRLISTPWYLGVPKTRPLGAFPDVDTALFGGEEPLAIESVEPEAVALSSEPLLTPTIFAPGVPATPTRENWLVNTTTPYRPGTNPSISGVPEPAAWALMTIGFLSIGAAIRRSRRTTLAAA